MGKNRKSVSQENFRRVEELFNSQRISYFGTYVAACYGDPLELSNDLSFKKKVIAESVMGNGRGDFHLKIHRRDCHDGMLHLNTDHYRIHGTNGTFVKEILPNDEWHRGNRLPPGICLALGCGTCGFGTTLPERYEIAPCGFLHEKDLFKH